MKRVRVLLTGGHAATTALGVVQEIQKRGRKWDLFWVGPKNAMEGMQVSTSASTLLPDYGVYWHQITAGRLQKKWTRYTLPSLIKVPIGFLHAFVILFRVRPNLIVSFGGYAAFPIVVCGWILKVPVVAHSQTAALGISHKLSMFFYKKLALARPVEGLSKEKIELIGNPVMYDILKVRPKVNVSNTPVIYITGGSTGSLAINNVVEKVLMTLLSKYFVIHQTGQESLKRFKEIKKKLPKNLSGRYEVFGFYPKIAEVFTKADIVISRAGANTISDILVTQRPAILVPHPYVNLDEQIKNAKLVENTGQFLIIFQEDLTPESLIMGIEKVFGSWNEMANPKDVNLADLDRRAAFKFVDLLETCINV